MNEDELRNRLGRLDPVPDDVAVEPLTTPSSRARMEQIMNTPVIDQEDSLSASIPRPAPITARRRRNWMLLSGVAAAAVVAIGGAVIVGNRGDGGGTQVAAGPPLELSLPAGDSMAMCIQFDTSILAVHAQQLSTFLQDPVVAPHFHEQVFPRLSSEDDQADLYQEAGAGQDRVGDGYFRALARVTWIAERIEAALGMEPMPVPQRESSE